MRAWIVAMLASALAARAAQAQVVALGSSNTRGYDLPLSDAWPAQLEALLRAKGYSVSVANQGVNGDTSDGMLQRFESAVPSGTRVLIIDCCGNDNKGARGWNSGRFHVADHVGNIRALVRKAVSRGMKVIYLPNGYQGERDGAGEAAAAAAGARLCGNTLSGVPQEHRRMSEAGVHADAVGYGLVAQRVLRCVIPALGKRG